MKCQHEVIVLWWDPYNGQWYEDKKHCASGKPEPSFFLRVEKASGEYLHFLLGEENTDAYFVEDAGSIR